MDSIKLHQNRLSSSSIPNGIGRLRNLRHLDLSYSLFRGKIPKSYSYALAGSLIIGSMTSKLHTPQFHRQVNFQKFYSDSNFDRNWQNFEPKS
ncbi:hypothetical protein RND71_037485 [Anisodus tanguticus]|uniref:Uncharacterized protein n=1 Tax=Anisodus tanguticus TaxID=243964 RepID=A0AAE1R3T0_9SOLA|nr:hypothetical protein RND71_037485 [Anisodus tanguticus]